MRGKKSVPLADTMDSLRGVMECADLYEPIVTSLHDEVGEFIELWLEGSCNSKWCSPPSHSPIPHTTIILIAEGAGEHRGVPTTLVDPPPIAVLV